MSLPGEATRICKGLEACTRPLSEPMLLVKSGGHWGGEAEEGLVMGLLGPQGQQ